MSSSSHPAAAGAATGLYRTSRIATLRVDYYALDLMSEDLSQVERELAKTVASTLAEVAQLRSAAHSR